MPDQDPYAATAIKPAAVAAAAPAAKKPQTAAVGGDPYAATAIQAAAPSSNDTAARYKAATGRDIPTMGAQTQVTPIADRPNPGRYGDYYRKQAGHQFTDRERFMMNYPVGERGEGVGESLYNVLQNAGVGVYQGIDALAHPVRTLENLTASVMPQELLNANHADWQKNVIDPWVAAHPGQPVPANLQFTDRDLELENIPNPVRQITEGMEHPGEFLPNMAGQMLTFKGAGKLIPKTENVHNVTESAMRRLAGSGPGVANKLVRAATEDNRVIGLHNADKLADAQQAWQEKQSKVAADYRAELLRLRQKYALKDVPEARAAYKEAFDKAQQANAEARAEYNRRIGETAQHNRTVTQAVQDKSAQDARIQVGGSQLIYGLNQLDKALNARAATMFDTVRDLVAKSKQPPLPGTGLGTAARSALTKISGTSEVPKVFRDILGKYPESEPETIAYQGAQIPRGHPLYDVLAKNGAVTAAPVTFGDLQGYFTETGAELSKGTLPGDVFTATKELHNAIGDMMQDMAKKAGPEANKMFWDSRVFYRGYMDTFHEPTGPSGSGSPVAQALLAKDPATAVAKFTGDSGDRGISDLLRYSHGLANLAQDVRRVAQTKIPAPASKSVLDIPQPKIKPVPAGANLPLPPVLPEMEQVPFREPKLTPTRTISADDLRRANDDAVRAGAEKLTGRLFWWTGIWPAFRMLSELTRNQDVSLRPLALMPASGAVGMATEELLSHPAVREFFTRPTRQQIAAIPLELRGDMPRIIETAKTHGVQISPLLAAYAASVQRNRTGQPRQQGTLPPPSIPVAQAIQAMQGAVR